MQLINWKVLFEEDMKTPGFKEEFDREYEEFCKQNDAELAAERANVAANLYKLLPRTKTTQPARVKRKTVTA